jgi:hypothetical protein
VIVCAVRCPTAAAQFTIEVRDWNNQLVTDAEVSADFTMKSAAGSPQKVHFGENRWHCGDGTCTIDFLDPNAVELELTVRSALLNVRGQTETRCYSELQRHYTIVNLKKPLEATYSRYGVFGDCNVATARPVDPCNCCCWSPPACDQTNAFAPQPGYASRPVAVPVIVSSRPSGTKSSMATRQKTVPNLSPGLLARLCGVPYRHCYNPPIPTRIRSEPITRIDDAELTADEKFNRATRHQGVDLTGPLTPRDLR